MMNQYQMSSRTPETGITIPMVVDKKGHTERTWDIFSRLMENRIIYLSGQVEDNMASIICSQLLYLDSVRKEKIQMFINSPGGVVTAGLSIFDTMNYIESPVETICLGQACSMGSFLLMAGEPGMRFSLPSSRIMIHQPSGGAQGQATDIEIQAKEILRLRSFLNGVYAKNCNKPIEDIERAMERDNFMSAAEALEFGLIDGVIEKNPTF